MLFDCRPKVLHKHCLQFLLGVKVAPRETENNAYAKFWGDKQRTLWYVMVFLEWSITSKLPLTKPAISIQTDCASSFVSSYDSLDWRFESFASLPSISDWVMTSTKITHSYYSLFSSTDSLKVLLQAQQELKQRHSDSLCETRSHSWWDTRAPASETSNFRFLLLLGRQLAHKNIRYQSPPSWKRILNVAPRPTHPLSFFRKWWIGCHSSGKFPRGAEHPEKEVLFSGRDVPNGNSCSIC